MNEIKPANRYVPEAWGSPESFGASMVEAGTTYKHPDDPEYVLASDYDALRAEVERLQWRGIESLPDDDTIILAKTDDGRVMVYRGSILARNLRGPTPEHLRFPATKWMHIP